MHPLNSAVAAPRSAAYSRYAEVYDRIGQRVFGENIAEATLHLLSSIGAHPTDAVDLACGTGAATLKLADAGIPVTGIDRSSSMLAVARAAAERANLPISWQEQDLREFKLSRPVDLVTCFYDAVNYLLEIEDVHAAFARAFEALRPGGHYVFDLNTREKFQTSWNTCSYIATDRDDLFGVYQSWYEEDTGLSPLILTFFVRGENNSWERFDEEHVERVYELEEIHGALIETGFQVRAMLEYADRSLRFGGPGSERSHRVVFVAMRPSSEE